MNWRDEDGMSLIEVLVAAMIALAGMAAAISLLVGGSANSLGQQRQASINAILNQQVENAQQVVKVCGFDALGLTAAPAPGPSSIPVDPAVPGDLVRASSSKFAVPQDFHNTTSGWATGTTSAGEPLVIRPSGCAGAATQMTPTSTVTNGNLTATVYRFITERTEGCRTAGTCSQESRRVTIAVVPTAIAGNNVPDVRGIQWLTTVIDNPIPINGAAGSGGLELGVQLP